MQYSIQNWWLNDKKANVLQTCIIIDYTLADAVSYMKGFYLRNVWLFDCNQSEWMLSLVKLAKFHRQKKVHCLLAMVSQCIKHSTQRNHFQTKQIFANLRKQFELIAKSAWDNLLLWCEIPDCMYSYWNDCLLYSLSNQAAFCWPMHENSRSHGFLLR